MLSQVVSFVAVFLTLYILFRGLLAKLTEVLFSLPNRTSPFLGVFIALLASGLLAYYFIVTLQIKTLFLILNQTWWLTQLNILLMAGLVAIALAIFKKLSYRSSPKNSFDFLEQKIPEICLIFNLLAIYFYR
ncbi:hypothetical protein [Tellurirhabdus bombi]|uniref:hypothetical protein n=1 Tax=Tellurirhabdus bombi TaxID=2907205 RepID=UPI001F1E2D19|nr:hypothetical protein [Tellurirhabdus bombi]